MKVLISNDDGIFAPGIRVLAEAVAQRGHQVTIYAPSTARSGASHSFSIDDPLRVVPVEFGGMEAYSVSGTPADCVRLGLYLMRDNRPDFVLTGVNNGSNLGAALAYSGTLGAAFEGSMCGVPAMAVSLCSHRNGGFETAARVGAGAIEWALAHPLPRGDVYTLNFPDIEQVKGIRWSHLSNEYLRTPDYSVDAEGCYHYERTPDDLPLDDPEGDTNYVRAGYASLSIVTWNADTFRKVPGIESLEAFL